MSSFTEYIKKMLTPTGSPKRIARLKEWRSMFMTAIFAMSFLFSVLVFVFMAKQMGMFGTNVEAEYERNIAVLHLNKPITMDYITRIMGKLDQLKEKIEDGSFNHLLIVASSPGGSPQGSEELAKYLLEYKKMVPITLYVQELCASGCYYIASAIEKEQGNDLSGIIANPNSVVGSIGVVMPHLVYGPALQRFGVDNEYLVEGEYKVPIDSWALASDDAKAYFKKNLLGPVYANFQQFVKEHRHFSDDQLNELNGGRIFLATLVEGSLVDRISNVTDVKNEIKKVVEAKYPDDEVGFVTINTNGRPKLPFVQSLFHVDNVTIGGSASLAKELVSQGQQYNMQ